MGVYVTTTIVFGVEADLKQFLTKNEKTGEIGVIPEAQGVLPPIDDEYPEDCYHYPVTGWLGEMSDEDDWPGIKLDAVDSNFMSSDGPQFLGRIIGSISDYRYDPNTKKFDIPETELPKIRQALLELGFDDDEIGFYLIHQIG